MFTLKRVVRKEFLVLVALLFLFLVILGSTEHDCMNIFHIHHWLTFHPNHIDKILWH